MVAENVQRENEPPKSKEHFVSLFLLADSCLGLELRCPPQRSRTQSFLDLFIFFILFFTPAIQCPKCRVLSLKADWSMYGVQVDTCPSGSVLVISAPFSASNQQSTSTELLLSTR